MGQDEGDSEVVGTAVQGNGARPPEVTEFPDQYISLEEYAQYLAEQPRAGIEEPELETNDPVVKAAYRLLKSKRITSWAGFTVATHEGRLKAAEWYARAFQELRRAIKPSERTID